MTKHPTFVHLTDLHVGDPNVKDDHLYSDTTATLRAILEDVKRLTPQPDFIVASGDLTNLGDEGSYRQLLSIFGESGLDLPVIWALGNHDERPGFYRVVQHREDNLDAPYDHDTVIAGIHVITLDTSVPGQVGGSFEPGQLEWLEERLGDHPELPKLLVMHHAPSLDEDNYSGEWEAITCEHTIRLRELLTGRNVVGILSGHVHHDRFSNWNGIPLVVGIGQHAAMDVTWLHQGLRMVQGSGFGVGTIRPSGLTMSLIPQPSDQRELMRVSFEELAEKSEAFQAAKAASASE